MVNVDASGILFTANPINGKRNEMVISITWGLGEAIVGGLVSPDNFVADKTTGKVKQLNLAEKIVIIMLTERGARQEPLKDARRNSQVLNEAQVTELFNPARRIEDFYGSPQDIEWCHANGSFFTLQSCPITALPKATLAHRDAKRRIWPKGAFMNISQIYIAGRGGQN